MTFRQAPKTYLRRLISLVTVLSLVNEDRYYYLSTPRCLFVVMQERIAVDIGDTGRSEWDEGHTSLILEIREEV